MSTMDFSHLSVDERLQLLDEIWESLCENPEALPLSDAQREELDRRVMEMDRDGVVGIPVDEALEQIRNSAS